MGLFLPLSCATNPVPTPREIAAAVPANVGFSNRPSWLSWEVARQKQFFQKSQTNVDLKWFDGYAESVLALESGLLDANTQTLGLTSIHFAPVGQLSRGGLKFSWHWWLNKYDAFSDIPVSSNGYL